MALAHFISSLLEMSLVQYNRTEHSPWRSMDEPKAFGRRFTN